MTSPRERFVESMRVLVKLPGYLNAKRAAVEAFADYACGDNQSVYFSHGVGKEQNKHSTCRKLLARECGLSD